jgi:hypothetical protein
MSEKEFLAKLGFTATPFSSQMLTRKTKLEDVH